MAVWALRPSARKTTGTFAGSASSSQPRCRGGDLYSPRFRAVDPVIGFSFSSRLAGAFLTPPVYQPPGQPGNRVGRGEGGAERSVRVGLRRVGVACGAAKGARATF